MSAMSRSLKRVLQEALQVSQRVLRRFSNRFSPHKFTQPQLFACLVMKEFLGQDYRTAARLLADSPDLQKWIGLAHPPHYTTLHKASQRLLRAERARRLLQAELARGRRLGCCGRAWRPRRSTAPACSPSPPAITSARSRRPNTPGNTGRDEQRGVDVGRS
jgi:hypothetical protein